MLVEFEADAGVSLIDYGLMEAELGQMLGRRVDLVPKAGLKKRIRDSVLSSAELVYAH